MQSSTKRRKFAEIRKDNSDHILTVAETLFAEHGYKGTTVAAIADQAKLPKANVLYYFKSKEILYQSLLRTLLSKWMQHMDEMTAEQHPRDALRTYIINKILQSKRNPNASKIFAAEILHGAPFLREQLEVDLRNQFNRTCQVIRSWIAKEWMDPINPQHLIFMIWSSTQAYADFNLQSSILMNKAKLDDSDFEDGAELISRIVLKGCGISLL